MAATWRLTQAGYSVVATARKVESLDGLPVALKLPLDVTQPQSVTQTVERAIQQFGRIDVLVNNAGYTVYGAVEEITDEQVQQLFDTNVFGALRMVRAVAPTMRKQGHGRIINLSSIVGKLPFPVNGVYSSTKFALEALSDALRLEMADLGIQVVLIEPAAVNSAFGENAQAKTGGKLSNPASPYHALYQKFEQFAATQHQQASQPAAVSKVAQQAIEAAHSKARYLVGVGFSGRLVMALGDSAWDLALRQILKIAA